jgi:hypothetical protein
LGKGERLGREARRMRGEENREEEGRRVEDVCSADLKDVR